MSRAEIGALSDVALQLRYDRLCADIADDWRRGAPGRLSHVFDLALCRLEAEIRSLSLTPIYSRGFDPLPGFPEVDSNGDLIYAD